MKKLLIFSVLVLSIHIVYCQDDFEKIQQEFEKSMNDPKNTFGKNKVAGKYYPIRGFKMYAEVYGQGQPVLIIHGNGGSIGNFLYQIPYFSKKYKVIVADSRAQGKSEDKGDSLTYEMMADDYAALLDAMKIDSAFVIGWSDGGINGLLLAIRHPEKVKKLAITGTNLRPDTTAVPKEVWDLITPMYQELKNKTGKNALEQNQYKLLRLLVQQPNIDLSDVNRVNSPTLVMGGDHDVIKVEHTMEIFKNIPNAYLWILPNSGHSTPVVYAAEFNKKIDDFFNQPYRKFDTVKRFF
ncbi:MAG TPA: alpha/beta hydrolase [Ferruginibacter sp.]|nr:alpha/beta hydrolase [Ferruginibacter sp.]